MMEVENMSSTMSKEEEEDDAQLPGFRFHPTDEELVGFYLRRKVDKRPIRLDLIKLVDIYKFDPWDLPKWNSSGGDKEWYFFCRRGRKYKNSMRPNRVTKSGFWKATGIDRPIYSSSGRECIGLKKSLVYYRGSAGKGTKTEWMMHEFRLPAAHDKSTKHILAAAKPISQQEAEVWTLCRILKRSASYRKCVPDWREMAAAKRSDRGASSETCSVESSDQNGQSGNSSYISFTAPVMKQMMMQTEKKPPTSVESFANEVQQHQILGQYSSYNNNNNSNIYGDVNEFLRHAADWEDLRCVVDCAAAAAAEPLYAHQYY